jgi:crossover junction endodeoxyribonuclease RuvC
MVVFGIDPGSTVTAYGVVTLDRGRYRMVDAGCVRTRPEEEMTTRLLRIHEFLAAALARHTVDEAAIESIFLHKSSESAIRLGQARGVALLALAQKGHAAHEYNASTVKRTIGAHGKADKADLARIVKLLLGELPEGPADLSDALAIAMTHLAHARNRAQVGAGSTSPPSRGGRP